METESDEIVGPRVCAVKASAMVIVNSQVWRFKSPGQDVLFMTPSVVADGSIARTQVFTSAFETSQTIAEASDVLLMWRHYRGQRAPAARFPNHVASLIAWTLSSRHITRSACKLTHCPVLFRAEHHLGVTYERYVAQSTPFSVRDIRKKLNRSFSNCNFTFKSDQSQNKGIFVVLCPSR